MRLLPLLALTVLLAACDRGVAPPQGKPAPERPERPAHADMVPVSGGPFPMGSDRVDTEDRWKEFGSRRPWYLDEHPRRLLTLGPFLIDRTEVTEGAFARFVNDYGYNPPPHWKDGAPERPEHPVINVNWMDAQNYCHWRGARLPTEAEWEKAARGTNGREYPWGDGFERDRANVGQLGDTTEAGHFPEGAGPYGTLDQAGNVWEWTASWYQAYPGSGHPDPDFGRRAKVLRGGSSGGKGGHYQLEQLTSRTGYRFFLDPRARVADVGFRCAQAIDSSGNPIGDHQDRLHG